MPLSRPPRLVHNTTPWRKALCMGRNVVVLAFQEPALSAPPWRKQAAYLYSLLTGTSVMLASILRCPPLSMIHG
jgi:hypothetical protein